MDVNGCQFEISIAIRGVFQNRAATSQTKIMNPEEELEEQLHSDVVFNKLLFVLYYWTNKLIY